jgi:hypothetical protein
MTTIDNLLIKIVNHASPAIEEQIPQRDSKILRSIASSINSHIYITENQSKLLIKILREHENKITDFSQQIQSALTNLSWAKPFRRIEQVKKLQIKKNEEHESILCIEITFSHEIRQILTNLSKSIPDMIAYNTKNWQCELTEKNIVTLYDTFAPLNFEIDEDIKNYYTTIKSWSKSDIENQFLITNIEHKNFQKAITDDLGLSTTINQNIINDRSMRYQYHQDPKNLGEDLTENIANRSKPRIWIDKKQHTMTAVVASIIELKRLPLLIVFDTLVNNKYLENLKILSKSLEENGIFDGVGVYFRLPNDEIGTQFNTFIAEKSYNYQLCDDTNVACVMSGKLPKFFLRNAWKPMSVIALDSRMGMRHGKTAVYSNCCDLIIEWADEPSTMDIKLK